VGFQQRTLEEMVTKDILQHFCGKTVLITGHTGFKGSWMTYLLSSNDVYVVGYSLPPNSIPNLYNELGLDLHCESNIADVNDLRRITEVVKKSQPDFIFHMAAQPLVRYSYRNPIETFSTNIMGTANVLEACKVLEKKCCVVCITTDKVYHNNEWLYPYRETDSLGGYDPYSSSKAAAELVIDSYRKSFFANSNIFVASARAGNVIGGGDWSEDRLIPDIVRAAQKNENVTLRNPNAVRPWQHVLDPIFGYLLLAKVIDEKGSEYCEAYNFGPRTDEAKTVFEVCETIMAQLSAGKVIIEDQKIPKPHEAGLLTLDISKSMKQLGWSPIWNSDIALKRTASWYQNFLQTDSAISLMKNDINLFISNESI
jgi:CDP-glucose 4,6-dehydratase